MSNLNTMKAQRKTPRNQSARFHLDDVEKQLHFDKSD